jgi:type II secretory pathway pseudopilin PulG
MKEAYLIEEKQAGFTLIEMAIFLAIGSIMLGFLGSSLLNFIEKNKISATEYRLSVVKDSLGAFLSQNARYPCPASLFGEPIPTNTNYNREVTATCNAGAFTGTFRVMSTTPGQRVRIGAVPTRTLNIPDDFAADAWGNRFTYAVTERQATAGSPSPYTSDGGVIDIEGITSAITVASNVHYVVISHGPSREGGYTIEGDLSIPCNAGSRDTENCDNANTTFVQKLVENDYNSAAFFDDYLTFRGQENVGFEFPPNAVMAFNRNTCPEGWRIFPISDARFIIGATASGTPINRPYYNIALDTPPGTPDEDYPLGEISPRPRTTLQMRQMIPDYVSYIHCQKN